MISRVSAIITALVLATVASPARAVLVSGGWTDAHVDLPYHWVNAQGEFLTVGGYLGGGPVPMRAAYDYDTQVFSLTANGLSPLAFDGLFAISAIVERDTGRFISGGFAWTSGESGISDLSIAPYTLLMAGAVIDWDNRPGPKFPELELYPQLGTTLLEVAFVAPQLASFRVPRVPNPDITSYRYLTVNPGMDLAFAPTAGGIWSHSWEGWFGPQGYELYPTWKVPEPDALALAALGLFAVGARGRRKSLGVAA